MNVRLLVSADLHLGRRPSKVADRSAAERFSTTAMWGAIVEYAIAHEVAAVLLAGDVIDHRNRFFEATGPLERGILQLAEQGIEIFAVAGNHDWDVLPQVADALNCPAFRLLGRGGQWEEARLERDGQTLLRIQGWSFPAATVRRSPLEDCSLPGVGHAPLVGLLHCDLDAAESPHAPVALAELAAREHFALWALGHIHVPRCESLATGARLLYPGSPQAMDPGEPGRHGPWLVEIGGAGEIDCRQAPISKVRYESVSVDVEGAESLGEVRGEIVGQFRGAAQQFAQESPVAEWLSLRLKLVGKTRLCGKFEELASLASDLDTEVGQATACVEAVIDETRPALDLPALAKRGDPPGLLAALLLRLEEGETDEALQRLLASTHDKMLQVHKATAYQPLVGDPPPSFSSASQMLHSQGLRLLSELLDQVSHEEEIVA